LPICLRASSVTYLFAIVGPLGDRVLVYYHSRARRV
jgi:hypothetical protein